MTRPRVKNVAPSPTARPDYQVLPPLSAEEYAALKEDIRVSGRVRDPVITTRDGTVLDGHNRVRAWTELRAEGVALPDYPRLIRQDLADSDDIACRAAARQYNLQRRHLDDAARRALIADQLRETPERSDPSIARDLGVGVATVNRVRHAIFASLSRERSPSYRVKSNGIRYLASPGALDPAIESDLRNAPATPNSHIAARLGCAGKRVALVRERMEQAGEIPVVHLRLAKNGTYSGSRPPKLVDPPDIPVGEQDTIALRREHARLRTRARAIDAELRTREPVAKPEPPPLPPSLPKGLTVVAADAADLREFVRTGTVDLIVTSPPHNLGQPYADGVNDARPYADFLGPKGVARRWARELARIARPESGRLCLHTPLQSWIDGEPRFVVADWRHCLEAAGWRFRGLILWAKSAGALGRSNGTAGLAIGTPSPSAPVVNTTSVEGILVLYRGDHWSLGRNDDNGHDLNDRATLTNGLWTFPAQQRQWGENGQVVHPAPYPEELPRRLISLFSFRDALIADPFSGSGTTAAVAHRQGRRCFASDLSPTYVRQTLERLAGETSHVRRSAPHPR
ncbi:MAG TPA: DNA methyltransferase [Chloroflexota bacterium]|jgi:site-specific DNA-methyltransferase (adenine-specific)